MFDLWFNLDSCFAGISHEHYLKPQLWRYFAWIKLWNLIFWTFAISANCFIQNVLLDSFWQEFSLNWTIKIGKHSQWTGAPFKVQFIDIVSRTMIRKISINHWLCTNLIVELIRCSQNICVENCLNWLNFSFAENRTLNKPLEQRLSEWTLSSLFKQKRTTELNFILTYCFFISIRISLLIDSIRMLYKSFKCPPQSTAFNDYLLWIKRWL